MSEPTPAAPRTLEVRWLASPWWLMAAVVAAYAVSLGGGWLAYDDDWLARDNELLNRADPAVLGSVLFGLDRETRLVLGAEYLPVRDLVTWIARAWLGLDATGLRALMLGVYAGASALLLRWASALRPGLDGSPGAGPAPGARAASDPALVLAVWIFALHPVHAESVAWIASLKDVLALLFVAAALTLYAAPSPRVRLFAAGCVLLACLSKGLAVVAPALMLAGDLLAGRRTDRVALGASLAVAASTAALHAWVGRTVGMLAPPLGEGLEPLFSMSVVLARYVGLAALLHPHALVYDVPVHGLDAASIASLTLLAVLVLASLVAYRRGLPWPAIALAVFVAALLPVSQLLAPLQNRMADRYLLFALLGPSLALAHGAVALASAVRARGGAAAVLGVILVGLGGLSAVRAATLADPIAAFTEATERTEASVVAPYMLGESLVAAGRLEEAELAYQLAIARDGLTTDRGRRAGNNLGRLLVRLERPADALTLYAALVARYPDDPRVLHNLAVLETAAGLIDAAEAHRAELARRFPGYAPGHDPPGPR